MTKNSLAPVLVEVGRAFQRALSLTAQSETERLNSRILRIDSTYNLARQLKQTEKSDKVACRKIAKLGQRILGELSRFPHLPVICDWALRDAATRPVSDATLPDDLRTDYEGFVTFLPRHLEVLVTCSAGYAEQGLVFLFDPGTPKNHSRKSLERLFLLEPTLKIFVENGKDVGFSEHGHLMRIMKAFHHAYGLEAPKPSAVKQAVRDFKKSRVARPD